MESVTSFNISAKIVISLYSLASSLDNSLEDEKTKLLMTIIRNSCQSSICRIIKIHVS